jgi:peptide/nickel transport system ATP-binding protein
MSDSILSLEHLGVRLPKGADRPHALSDVSLAIKPDEILCVVGESGSGKSMMANAIMRLLPNDVMIDGGRVMFEGKDLASATVAEMRQVRGAGIAMIFQEPMTALNPLRTIGDQIAEMFSIHTDLSKAEIADRVVVMQHGVIVEQGVATAVLNNPQHAYTKQLIAAVPPLKAPPPRALSGENILTISGVSKTYRTGGFLGRGARVTPAVKDVTLHLPRGATLGIVGESGSGKSTLARCLVRLIDPDSGSIVLEGKDWAKLSREEVRRETRHIQMVFQDPFASLNPRRKAAELVAQGPIVHGTPRAEALADARELFTLVGLDPSAGDRFPHEFSGGQRQRIGLARALALKPDVLVADEPVSALDVSVQAQVLKLLAELRQRLGLSIVFITHDLRVAAQICDLVAVMKDGAVVEQGLAGEVFGNPQHPYTQALLASIPGGDFTRKRDAAVLG